MAGERGIAEDRAGAQRAGPILHAALHPAHRLAVGQRLRRGCARGRPATASRIWRRPGAARLRSRPARTRDRGRSPAWRQARRRLGSARLAEEGVIADQRRTERAAGIAGGGLHPDVVENALAQDLAVGDAVERHAAGQAQMALARLGAHRAGEPQHHLLRHRLDRGRHVHVELRERLGRVRAPAGRTGARRRRWSWSGRCSSRNISGPARTSRRSSGR